LDLGFRRHSRNLPETITGAEWQIDFQFNRANEILSDPNMKAVFQDAIANGVKVVTWR